MKINVVLLKIMTMNICDEYSDEDAYWYALVDE